MENKIKNKNSSNIIIYFDGKIIQIDAKSFSSIGNEYILYSDFNASGIIVGRFPIHLSGLVVNYFKQQDNGK